MPLKRSEVVRAEKEIEKAVYEYLEENKEEMFSVGEIVSMLKEKNLIPSDAPRLSAEQATAKAALSNLRRKKKAEQHTYDGGIVYGVKEKK